MRFPLFRSRVRGKIVTNPQIIETKQDKLMGDFVRISVEIAGDVMRFGRRGRLLSRRKRLQHAYWLVCWRQEIDGDGARR